VGGNRLQPRKGRGNAKTSRNELSKARGTRKMNETTLKCEGIREMKKALRDKGRHANCERQVKTNAYHWAVIITKKKFIDSME